jgi:hypothetical protein
MGKYSNIEITENIVMKKASFRSAILQVCISLLATAALAQSGERVRLVKAEKDKSIDVFIGGKLFTRFLFRDTLEKPVLYPIYTAAGTAVTRGFPFQPKPGEPTDHPHHTGLWFTYENVNGLDFWNNSYAIPAEKKHLYGWIKTDRIEKISEGDPGILVYHANWSNQEGRVLLEETTRFEFSGRGDRRMIDRITVLKADTEVVFNDAKDGMLGLRLAHELQIPEKTDQQFSDNKGNITRVKASPDKIANGNYLTSEGKQGDAAWGTRGVWCKVYGKMGDDSVSITMMDHPSNPGYPTFWHARGYGLFAANPLGENIFTQGKKTLNFRLHTGQTARFRYRILVDESATTVSAVELNRLASLFATGDH